MEKPHTSTEEHGTARLEKGFSKLSMIAMTFAILKYTTPFNTLQSFG
jgi:hypothetical protein